VPSAAAHARDRLSQVSPALRQLDPERLGDHFDRLFRAAWAMCGSREDAEDLVQETYTRVLGRRRLLRGDDDLGYLLRVLRNTHVSRLRAASRRLRPGPLSDDIDRVEDRATTGPQAALEVREVFAAIAALPPDFRDALVAVDVVGLSYGEAGRALRTPEATIASRLFRARDRVAQMLCGKESGSAGVNPYVT
jgi:RNA polymerase sigma-70 factor (ECF subfamily)